MRCRRFGRRELLTRAASGFGWVALAALLAGDARAGLRAAGKGLHHPARAQNVIFLHMDGGPSQVDTFDYKPLLAKHDGRDPHTVFTVEPTQFNDVGKVMASPWTFKQHGASGLWISELFPELAAHADDLCVIRSMVSKFPEHTSANYFLHTGVGLQGRPSMGAWISYGLGSENRDLPGFIVLSGGHMPIGGLDNFTAGFLPATSQGSLFLPGDPPVANIRPAADAGDQRRELDLVRRLDRGLAARAGHPDEIESAIANYETAFRMQAAVPELTDLAGETAATRRLYGLDSTYEPARIYARQCLIARRLVERGTRFIELTCPRMDTDRWDQHHDLRVGHAHIAAAVDRAIAGLLADLKARGLLETTLVVWAGEFGRTPFAQSGDGRDHNEHGFSIWMAGGGVRGGLAYGETDGWGYKAIKDRVEVHDLHATMLHLLGVDHRRLTFRFSGRDFRLTDVRGEVVRGVLA